MTYVLTRENQEVFFYSIIDEKEIEDKEILAMIDGCKHFYHTIYGNAYFLSKSVERRIQLAEGDATYIESIFNLTEDQNFYLETLNFNFINHLLQRASDNNIDLDSQIYEIHESFIKRYE